MKEDRGKAIVVVALSKICGCSLETAHSALGLANDNEAVAQALLILARHFNRSPTWVMRRLQEAQLSA